MRNILLFFIGIFMLSSAGLASAHALKVAGPIGVVAHLDPDDQPVAGQLSKIYLDVTDETQAFNPNACDCQATIKSASGQVIFQQPFVIAGAIQEVDVIFPDGGSYQLIVSGRPAGDPVFTPFSVTFDYFVFGPDPSRAINPLRSTLPYVMLAAGFVVMYLILSGLKIKEKK